MKSKCINTLCKLFSFHLHKGYISQLFRKIIDQWDMYFKMTRIFPHINSSMCAYSFPFSSNIECRIWYLLAESISSQWKQLWLEQCSSPSRVEPFWPPAISLQRAELRATESCVCPKTLTYLRGKARSSEANVDGNLSLLAVTMQRNHELAISLYRDLKVSTVALSETRPDEPVTSHLWT